MNFLLGLLLMAMGCSFIVYREAVGNMLGEPEWAIKVGGIYNVVIIMGVFFFFWGLATMTGTTDVLFGPILSVLPGVKQ